MGSSKVASSMGAVKLSHHWRRLECDDELLTSVRRRQSEALQRVAASIGEVASAARGLGEKVAQGVRPGWERYEREVW